MRTRWIVAVAALAVGATACGNASSGGNRSGGTTPEPSGASTPVDQPGVTSTEIRVSGVASVTNPLGGRYGTAFDGVQAYFDMVNGKGGIYGRKLVLAHRHDDQVVNNKREIEAILDQDHPFAVLPVATIYSFSGAPLLAERNVPTFGWNINEQWTGPPNFFGQVGALCNGGDCPSATIPWIAHRLHKKRVGVLAYNVANSAECADMVKASFDRYSTADVAFLDKSLAFGVTNLSADVHRMRDEHVDFVVTCMDTNGVLTLAREMRQQGLTATQYLPNGYNHDFMSKYGGFFDGSIVLVQEAPIETKPRFAALRDYVHWMKKDGYDLTENAEIGWINADELVTGLRLAGPTFTRQKVVDALNKLTSYDAGGLVAPIDWTKQHTDTHYPLTCSAFVKVHDGKFEPTLGSSGKPFTCWRGAPHSISALHAFSLR